MEWSKIKTIFIWIFLFVNLFLFSVYFKSMYTGKSLDDDIIKSTVEVLKINNITAKEDVIPKNYDNARVCTVENRFADVKTFLKNVFETDRKGIEFLTEDNVQIGGNTFYSARKEDATLDIDNYVKYTEKVLEDAGIITAGTYKREEKDGFLYFYLQFENKMFFDSYVRVKADSTGISEIFGINWLGDSIIEEGIAEAVSPAEILVNFAAMGKREDNIVINSMTAGYYLGERDETIRVTAAPVWRISTSKGDYFYDMKNGDLLE